MRKLNAPPRPRWPKCEADAERAFLALDAEALTKAVLAQVRLRLADAIAADGADPAVVLGPEKRNPL